MVYQARRAYCPHYLTGCCRKQPLDLSIQARTARMLLSPAAGGTCPTDTIAVLKCLVMILLRPYLINLILLALFLSVTGCDTAAPTPTAVVALPTATADVAEVAVEP